MAKTQTITRTDPDSYFCELPDARGFNEIICVAEQAGCEYLAITPTLYEGLNVKALSEDYAVIFNAEVDIKTPQMGFSILDERRTPIQVDSVKIHIERLAEILDYLVADDPERPITVEIKHNPFATFVIDGEEIEGSNGADYVESIEDIESICYKVRQWHGRGFIHMAGKSFRQAVAQVRAKNYADMSLCVKDDQLVVSVNDYKNPAHRYSATANSDVNGGTTNSDSDVTISTRMVDRIMTAAISDIHIAEVIPGMGMDLSGQVYHQYIYSCMIAPRFNGKQSAFANKYA